jgi:hypothetical protein
VPVIDILVCILARVGFGILFMSGNIVIERLVGSSQNKVVVMFFYIFMILIMAIPGIALGIIASLLMPIGAEFVIILLGTVIGNIAVAGLVTFLCRNVLDYAELNNR